MGGVVIIVASAWSGLDVDFENFRPLTLDRLASCTTTFCACTCANMIILRHNTLITFYSIYIFHNHCRCNSHHDQLEYKDLDFTHADVRNIVYSELLFLKYNCLQFQSAFSRS